LGRICLIDGAGPVMQIRFYRKRVVSDKVTPGTYSGVPYYGS